MIHAARSDVKQSVIIKMINPLLTAASNIGPGNDEIERKIGSVTMLEKQLGQRLSRPGWIGNCRVLQTPKVLTILLWAKFSTKGQQANSIT